MKKLVFAFFILGLNISLFAGQSNNSNFISGPTVAPAATYSTLANSYSSYPNPTAFTDVNILNTVGVMIDHSSLVYQASRLDYTFNLRLTKYNPALTSTVQDISLQVVYDRSDPTAYKDQNIFSFNGNVRIDVQILSIIDNATGNPVSNPADIFMVRTEINIERYYPFTYTAAPSSLVIIPVSGTSLYQYNVSWSPQVGAEEYDIEWTWVNTYTSAYGSFSTAGLFYDFRNNSSRARTSATLFNISNIFDEGVLVVRVRGIGRNPSDWSRQVFGAWSVPLDKAPVNSLPVSTYVTVSAHQAALNWQYSVTYSEEGKKKESVSYFDGTLRSRQSVSKSNTTNEVIVAEIYYDYQGRKGLESLPVPTMDQSPEMRFYPAFNVNNALQAYSRNDFDKDSPDSCDGNTGPFHNSQGAGNYYSQLNALNVATSDDRFNAFLPEANGFPFIRTEYTPDNSGKVRRQGGLGPDHQLGSGHESRYYYGKPLQFELDRLFGNEAGYSRFYKKDMVIDQNGQVNISYKDPAGKVIATALAGDAPDATNELPSFAGAATAVEADLLEKEASGKSETNRLNLEGDALVFNSGYLVTEAGMHTFSYQVTAPAYTDDCLNTGICFDCTYDLTIRITDDCGKVLAERTEYIGSPQLDNSCSVVAYSTTASPLALSLAVGNYQVFKELRINKAALDYYLEEMMDPSQSCFKSKTEFIAEEMAAIDYSGCEVTCDQCVEQLGTRDEYVLRGLGTERDWELAYERCIEPCADESKCQTLFRLMLADVSPGGQYAEWYDTSTARMNTSAFPLSIFNANNYLPDVSSSVAYWKNPVHITYGTGYYRENGTRAAIPIAELQPGVYYPEVTATFSGSDGQLYAYPEHLVKESDFILYWENSWAYSLVLYHPEYCYYEWCGSNDSKNLNNLSSEDFDNILINTDSKSQADYLNIYASPGSINNLLDQDPYFNNGGRGASQKALMAVILNSSDLGYTGYSIFQIAALSSRCPGFYATGTLPSGCTAYGTGTDSNVFNAEWVNFRNLYLAEKLKLQEKAAHAWVRTNCSKGVNTCIGQTSYNPYTDGITGWEFPGILNDATKICSDITSYLYSTKVKRFVAPREMEGMTKAVTDFNLFYLTGQCPEAVHLQSFLNQTAIDGNLLNNVNLEHKLYFPQDLYKRINFANCTTSNGICSTYTAYTYTPTLTGNKLQIQFKDPVTNTFSTCTIELELPTGYNYSQVKVLKDLLPDDLTADPKDFQITAMVDHDGNVTTPLRDIVLHGKSCFEISGCAFETDCQPNDFATDLLRLMNFLRNGSGNQLLSSSPVNLESAPYDAYVTDAIKNMMTPITGNRRWVLNSNKFYLYSTSSSDNLEIEFLAFDPSLTYSDLYKIVYFATIKPDPNDPHGFYLVAYYNHDGDTLTDPRPLTIKGRINFTNTAFDNIRVLGDCNPQVPDFCKSPQHLTKNHLEPFLNRLVVSPLGSTTNLSAIGEWTKLLQGQLGTGSYKIGAAQLYYDSIVYDIISDEFTPGTFKTICKLKLYRIDPYFNNRYDFANIVKLRSSRSRTLLPTSAVYSAKGEDCCRRGWH